MQRHRCFLLALSLITSVAFLCGAPSSALPAEPEVKTASTEAGKGVDPPPAGDHAAASGHDAAPAASAATHPAPPKSILAEFWNNFRHNLFKPLLLFFYM